MKPLISFPLLGSGNNGYDLELAFEIAYHTLQQFESHFLKTVYLVVYGARVAKLVADKGINYVELPEVYVYKAKAPIGAVPYKKGAVENAIAQVGDFLGKKENWDAMLDVATRIVKLILMFK